jgi:hypothetical protein
LVSPRYRSPANKINFRSSQPNDFACTPTSDRQEVSRRDSRRPDASDFRLPNSSASTAVFIIAQAPEALTISEALNTAHWIIGSNPATNRIRKDSPQQADGPRGSTCATANNRQPTFLSGLRPRRCLSFSYRMHKGFDVSSRNR